MSLVRMILLFVAAMLLQWWLSAYFLVFDMAPRLLLVLTVAIATRLGPIPGMCYGFAWGLFLDVLRAQLFGANALAYTIIAYGTGAVRRQIDVVGVGPQAVTVLLMTWGYLLLSGFLGLIFIKVFFFPGWRVFLLNPLSNAVLVPIVYVFWEKFMVVRR